MNKTKKMYVYINRKIIIRQLKTTKKNKSNQLTLQEESVTMTHRQKRKKITTNKERGYKDETKRSDSSILIYHIVK